MAQSTHFCAQVSQNIDPSLPGDPPLLLTSEPLLISLEYSPLMTFMHTNMFLTFRIAWDHHGVDGRPFSPCRWSDPFTDSLISILAPPNLLQTLLECISRIFRRVCDD